VTPVDHGARARLEAAFAREERRGLMLAAAARSTAVVIILGWLAVSNPERGPAFAWVLGTASVFLVTGVAQLCVYFRGAAPPIAPYAFMLVDSLALAAVLLFPNPFDTKALPQKAGSSVGISGPQMVFYVETLRRLIEQFHQHEGSVHGF
jgi:hypothetical protein